MKKWTVRDSWTVELPGAESWEECRRAMGSGMVEDLVPQGRWWLEVSTGFLYQ